MSVAAGVGGTGVAFPTKRLKYVVTLRRARTSADDAARPYVGLEDIESGTGRLVNGARGKWGSSPSAPSVTDGGGEPGRCFDQNDGGSGSSASSAADGNEATGTDFEPGDVLFGKLRPYLAKAWVAEFPGRCTTEALVMAPTSIEPRFLRSVCLSSRFVGDVDASTFGSKMPRAEWGFIGNMPVPVPDPNTQRAIADHLDRETARLDALVAAKQRLLTLLAEKRRAVITRAVTRGLDPHVPLRDSGVPWLGEIPAHWKIKRLKHVVTLRRLRTDTSVGDGARPYVGLEDIESGTGWLLNLLNGSGASNPSGPSETDDKGLGTDFNLGDVLFSKLRPYLAKAWVAEFPGRCTMEALVMKPTSIEPRFLRSVCLSSWFVADVNASTFGAKMPRAEWAFIGNMPVPVPEPKIQKVIADYLDHKTTQLDAFAAKIRETIDLLKERRAALITAAVTGRIAMPDRNKG